MPWRDKEKKREYDKRRRSEIPPEKIAEYQKRYASTPENLLKKKELNKVYQQKNKERVQALSRKANAKRLERVPKNLVASRLGVPTSEVSDALYSLVREKLLLGRALRELNKIIKQTKEDII